MKIRYWALPLLAAVSACSQSGSNTNMAAANISGPGAQSANPTSNASPPPTQVAQPAIPGDLACVRNRLSPEERQGVAQAAMEQAARNDPRVQPLLQAVDACGGELSWSPQKRLLATAFSQAAAGASGLQQEFHSRDIAIEELDPVILGDAEFMAAAETGQFGPAAASFAVRHNDELARLAGGPEALNGQTGVQIGKYMAFRAIAQTLAARFGREQ